MKEEDLIKGCIDENSGCQRELYDKYAGKMFSVCLRYASTREDAEDALQEAFIRIFDNISKFRGEGSFEGWMRRITVHTVLRLIQKKSPLKYAEDTSVLTKVSTASDVISQLSEKDILGLISRLPSGYKIVFNMYAIEGFSHGEIAENLGISEGTSRSQYSRAKKHLQHFIHKLYHID